MVNPILSQLMPAANNSMMQKLGMIQQMMQGKSPEQYFGQMMQTNPQFRQFVQENQGKTPEQIAAEHGIDFNMLKGMMK